MTIVNDETVLEDATAYGNWTTSGFDPPQDNNSSSSTYLYRANSACQEWVLKENIQNGYTYATCTGGTQSWTGGKILVAWFFTTGDADFDKLDNLYLVASSDTGFTTNQAGWDAKTQIYNLDYYGWYPVVAYPSNPDITTGTIVYSSLDSIGWRSETFVSALGTKLSGFSQFLLISYLGGHSQTVTPTNLYDNAITNDLGVWIKFGTFHKTHVNIRLGGGTSTTWNETGIQIYFDNIETDHNLGFHFVSDTGTNHFEMADSQISWNDQESDGAEVFTDASNADIFRVSGCSFTGGGAITLRTHVSDANTYFSNNVVDGCNQIDANTMLFEDNSIKNSRDSLTGAILLDSTGNSRWDSLSFTSSGSGHAIYITSTGTYSFDNYTYIGYGGTPGSNLVSNSGSTSAAVYNNSGGAVTINVNGGDSPAVRNGSGATTTVNNTKTFDFTLSPSITGYEWRIYEVTATGSLSGSSEVAGEETATQDNQDYSYSYSGDQPIGVQIIGHENDYVESITYYTLGNADQSVTIILTEDINN